MDFKEIREDYFATWKGIITRPEDFFANWDPNEDWEKALKFCGICALLAGLIYAVLTRLSGMEALILFPLFIFIGTVLGGVTFFVTFRLVGGKGGVEDTIKMVGYTSAVSVVSWGISGVHMLFPVVVLGAIYQLWLIVVGGKKVHQLGTVHSAVAVLVPVVVIGGFFLLLFGIMGLLTSGRG